MTEASTGFWRSLRQSILPRFGDALARFPLTIAGAGALTVFLILVTEDFRNWERDFDFILRIAGALACGALWSVSAVLIGEAKGKSAGFGHALGAIGAIILAGLFWFHRELDVVEYGISTALLVLIGLAPYLFRSEDNRAFWEFNHDVWIGAAFALLAGVLLAGGITATLATIEYLFKVDIRNETWPEVWIVALTFVAPLYWLNTIPKRFDVQVVEGDQKDAELTTRLITVLAKFILVPLLLVYTAILYVYAAKIGIGWELPKGRLGYMVSAFGVVGVVTALLIFPSRIHAGPLVRFFWQHWFWLTLVPLGLLFIGIWRRVSDYGLTQERYLLILLGIWLLVVVVLFGLRFLSRDLRLIPGAFVALLAITSIGPWGQEGLPLRLFVSELHGLLEAEGSLDANGVVKAKTELPKKRASKTAIRMASIVRYVERQDRLDRLRPLLGDDANEVIGTYATSRERRRKRHTSAQNVMARFVIPTHQTSGRDRRYVHFSSQVSKQISVPVAAKLTGPLRLFASNNDDTIGMRDNDENVEATIRNEILEIKQSAVVMGQYAIRPMMEKFLKTTDDRKRAALMLDPIAGSGKAQLLIVGFSGQFNADASLKVRNMDVWIVLPADDQN